MLVYSNTYTPAGVFMSAVVLKDGSMHSTAIISIVSWFSK